MRRNILGSLGTVAVIGLGAGIVSIALSGAAPSEAAQKTKTSATASLDQISWQQFVKAVTPSSTRGKVTYETWASDQDIYVANPCPPGTTSGCNVPAWPGAGGTTAAKSFQLSLLGRSHVGMARGGPGSAVQVIGPSQGCGSPVGLQGAAVGSGFPTAGCVGEEVRRDRASFNYMVQNGLWSDAGLAAFYKTGRTVAFPTNALAIKADWIPVATLATWLNRPQSFVTANFYTSSAQTTPNGPAALYAMTSMHVSYKASGYPNWIWANFENSYTPGRCDQTGCSDAYGAQLASVPAKSAAWGQYGQCLKTGALGTMMRQAGVSAIFAKYCLTGTQTSFGTATNPTLLGSPIIEPLNANVPLAVSSCISCHAGASFNAAGTPGNVGSPVGPNAPAAGYRGYDLMWGLLAAN